MLRNLFRSSYFKAGLTFLVSGSVLILFLNWVNATSFANAFKTLNTTLMPIYIGCGIAFIMCPVYNKLVNVMYRYFSGTLEAPGKLELEKKLPKRNKQLPAKSRQRALTAARLASTIITFFLIVGLISLFFYFVLPQIVQNIANLINTLPERMAAFSAWCDTHLTRFPQVIEAVHNVTNSGTQEVVAWIQEHILKVADTASIAQMISSGVFSVFSVIKDIFIGLLISIYLLNYKETLFAIARKLIASSISENRAASLYEFGGVLNETFIGFLVGRIIDALIIGVLTYIVLKVTHINMALLIAVIVGVTNIIPFFGPFLGAIPSFILVLMDSPIKALWFLVIIVVIQQLDGNVIGPKIVGNAIGLPSFWVLIAVLIGGGLFGVLGMLLGAPVFAVIYHYVDKGAKRRLKRKNKPTETEDYYTLKSYNLDTKEVLGQDEPSEPNIVEPTDGSRDPQ